MTRETEKGILMGQLPGSLSELGRRQVKQKAVKIAKYNPRFIYSSDLCRCVQTSKIITTYTKQKEFETTSALREIDFGQLQGSVSPEIDGRYVNDLSLHFPGGESNEEVVERVIDFINKLNGQHKNETVLVVTHTGPATVVYSSIKGINYKQALAEVKFDYTDVLDLTVSQNLPGNINKTDEATR